MYFVKSVLNESYNVNMLNLFITLFITGFKTNSKLKCDQNKFQSHVSQNNTIDRFSPKN